jgi:large subunit ribosomal protein L15
MNLNEVHRGIHRHKKRTRIGRGLGSGHGKTAGRGHKGQSSHAGWSCPPVFEGGQMPLIRRIPKRGFHNAHARCVAEINVGALNKAFADGAEVGEEALRQAGLIKGQFDLLKVLGDGPLTKKLKVVAHRFSKSALAKIQQQGGEAVVLPGPAPVVKRQKRAKKKSGA